MLKKIPTVSLSLYKLFQYQLTKVSDLTIGGCNIMLKNITSNTIKEVTGSQPIDIYQEFDQLFAKVDSRELVSKFKVG